MHSGTFLQIRNSFGWILFWHQWLTLVTAELESSFAGRNCIALTNHSAAHTPYLYGVCSSCSQWLNCKKKEVGELSTFLLPSPPVPQRAPWKPASGLPVGSGAKPWLQTHFGVFWGRQSHPAATFLIIYLSLKWCSLWKKLYWQEVPEWRSDFQKSSRTSLRCVVAQILSTGCRKMSW